MAYTGCWLNLDHLPFDIRKAAQRAHDEAKSELGGLFYFGDASKFISQGVGKGKAAFPHKCLLQLDPTAYDDTQLTNECTSRGCLTIIETSRAVDIVIRNEAESYMKKGTHAVYYGGRGERADRGASPITIHKNACKNGIALRQAYCDNKYDFTDYRNAWKLGVQFGGGIPQDLLDEIQDQSAEQYAVLQNEEEIQDAIYNGNGVGVGHSYCTRSRGGKNGVPWLASIGGSNCAHEEAIVGYDDTRTHYKDCVYLWDDSYDRTQIQGVPAEYLHNGVYPNGGYILDAADTMKRVRNGTAVTNSLVKGFPVRKLPSWATDSVFS